MQTLCLKKHGIHRHLKLKNILAFIVSVLPDCPNKGSRVFFYLFKIVNRSFLQFDFFVKRN